IKPISGVDLWVQGEDEDSPVSRLTLLAMDNVGYRNITELVSRGYTEGQRNGLVTVHRDWVAEASAGVIALSGAKEGEIGQALLAAVALAGRLGCPVVATNDVRFLKREDYEAHETRVCIGEGRALGDPRRVRLYSEEQYLKSPEEMAELFSDIPEALENSVE